MMMLVMMMMMMMCAGQECAANCRVQCGLLGGLCPAVSCSVANPLQCTGGTSTTSTTSTTTASPIISSCDSGYTLSGSKCYRVVTSSSNYLAAILGCVSQVMMMMMMMLM